MNECNRDVDIKDSLVRMIMKFRNVRAQPPCTAFTCTVDHEREKCKYSLTRCIRTKHSDYVTYKAVRRFVDHHSCDRSFQNLLPCFLSFAHVELEFHPVRDRAGKVFGLHA